MRKLPFNDEWLTDNHYRYKSYAELAKAHNELFGTCFSRVQMKNHAGLILGIRMDKYWYTEEMKAWIKAEYPKPGTSDEKARRFNKAFGTHRDGHSIKEMARKLGVALGEDALADYKRKSTDTLIRYNTEIKAKPIGYVGRPANGYPMVKTADGWMYQARYEYMRHHDEIPSGEVIIFLDGNVMNVSKENLMAIPQKWQAVMTANKFWSEHPMITRSGLVWCELAGLLKQQGIKGGDVR